MGHPFPSLEFLLKFAQKKTEIVQEIEYNIQICLTVLTFDLTRILKLLLSVYHL